MAAKGVRGVRLNPKHDERTRAKIQTSQIINRLERFVKAELGSDSIGNKAHKDYMTSTQVTAALGLLKKTLPDLASTEHSGTIEHKHDASEYSDSELAAIVSRAGSIGTADKANGARKPNKLH